MMTTMVGTRMWDLRNRSSSSATMVTIDGNENGLVDFSI